ncbi:MAG: transporter substrate-binding domain-containing protein [Burkholderiaceae bacterium]
MNFPRIALCLAGLGFIAAGAAAQAQALDGTLKKIADTKTITLGTRDSSIGFSYLDANQKSVGYSMDICHKIVDAIKAQLKIPDLKVDTVGVTSQNRIPLVQGGTVDMECGSTTNTIDRAKQVAFSPDIFRYNVRMVVRADSGIKSFADLNGKTVVTTSGTTSDALIKSNERTKNVSVKNAYGKDHGDSFLQVESGRAAAFVMDDILLAGLVANSKNPAEFAIVGDPLKTENYAIMFRKDDPQMKAIVDKTVIGLFNSGEIEKIYTKWLLSPIPPRNITINYPISAETRDAWKNPSDKGV